MTSSVDRRPPVEVVLCPGGPALVRGQDLPVDVVLTDEAAAAPRRPVVAVCRCGRTGREPWCDGTHKLAGRRARPQRSGTGTDGEDDR
ncbi:CDGSH iron-sulfur domain-containing protein [Mumia zhuanghuii]|uniref:CDGSH iron-sulfur domain-containing protein n=1 Tax=Mumia zhuanghuii TaxID=2585211 RepID=A0A5C4MN27_9ACTN|nr:CDGSH iron-sulfur domain-containing protein [Mumia zhuanghuii]TNC36586.1 CDGSH iron-sulfur domain-containing protein [Mumia zhuanghuii]TNC46361.1 CDGSH iron-sulfur domain-containing protein [Mumia zhuanghuii]